MSHNAPKFTARRSASASSPDTLIGRALLGHRVGDAVAVQAPGGSYELTIVSIETAPGSDHRRAV